MCLYEHGTDNVFNSARNEAARNAAIMCAANDDRKPLLGGLAPAARCADAGPVGLYKRRWYCLAVFGSLCFCYGLAAPALAPIAHACQLAYDWTSGDVAMILNWQPVVYLLLCMPVVWLIETRGLRVACLLASIALTVGTGMRCVYASPPLQDWLMHVGHVCMAPASCVVFSAPSCVSATWFPAGQRTTATAVSAVAYAVGTAVSFLLGPFIVPTPVTNSTIGDPFLDCDVEEIANATTRDITEEIATLMRISCVPAACLLVVTLVYFPARPPLPPSLSASTERLDFRVALLSLLRNHHFLVIGFVYSLTNGVSSCFAAVLDVNLASAGVSDDQTVTSSLIVSAVFATALFALLLARVADRYVQHLKLLLLGLYTAATAALLWLAVTLTGWAAGGGGSMTALYCSFIGGMVLMNSAVPLFYELACESCYPTSESLVNGALNFVNNAVAMVLLGVLTIPGVGTLWMTWCMVGASVVCIPILIPYKQRYGRVEIDVKVLNPAVAVQANEPDTNQAI